MKNLVAILFVFIAMTAFAQQELQKNLFKMSEVVLKDGPFKSAVDLNIQTLLHYDVDRLLEPFLTEAGLTPKGTRYVNWDGLAGHVGGHYLSALAMHYAATGNADCKAKMDYMITELKACQDANADGYLGGVPGSKAMWAGVKTGNLTLYNSKWVPWYNVHKTYAGLRDAYIYGGSETAKQMFLSLCDWGINIIAVYTTTSMQTMLDTEFGGMNEVYADAYQITGDAKYLTAAKKFTHNILYNSMAAQVDNLDNKHANTQIPKVIGFERVAQVDATATGYATAAKYFWQTVVNNRSLALGGNSRNEFFPSTTACDDYITNREGPETCNTYNMLKLSSDLFCDNHLVKYVDYYEKALFNHILSSQHPEHGGYVYFTSARPRHYRVYSAPDQAMWCCVGSGMENPAKHAQFIYSHDNNNLYVNLFIGSELTWTAKGVVIKQETTFPTTDFTTLTMSMGAATPFNLLVRYPSWVTAGAMEIKINNETFPITTLPGNFVSIDRTWNSGDVVSVKTPMHTSYVAMPNVPEYIAFMHGPILLGAKTGSDDLAGLVADDGRWSHIANGSLQALNYAPIVVSDRSAILGKITPIDGQPMRFKASALFVDQPAYHDLVLEPFSGIHDSRYMMYWMALTQAEYGPLMAALAAAEQAKLALDQRTVDAVATAQQQPEADHRLASSNSYTGIHMDETWRDARSGGYISYEMATGGNLNLSLMARYWGNESGARTFDILVDGVVIATENITGKWNKNEFVNVEYPIPNTLVTGKQYIVVKFQARAGNTAGGLFYVRLLKQPVSTAVNEASAENGLSVIYGDGQITLQSAVGNTASDYKLFDSRGGMVNRGSFADGQAIIPTNGMATGVYFVLTQLNDKVVCTKVILR